MPAPHLHHGVVQELFQQDERTGWGFAIQKAPALPRSSALFPSALLAQQDPFSFDLRNLQHCQPQGDQKKKKITSSTYRNAPPTQLCKNCQLKSTGYLKLIFNLYLKLQHLSFHAFPCERLQRKASQEAGAIVQPGLQTLNPWWLLHHFFFPPRAQEPPSTQAAGWVAPKPGI